ncbi:MAG: Rossmann-like and DUF2520 domain-containing protein [Anaerovoracaceae bacterium]
MRIGFIGAGKAGNSLARHFARHNIDLSGFYSKTDEHAIQAADYTKSAAFFTIKQVVEKSDIIFITTPDGKISKIWEEIRDMELSEKTIVHCSGSLSSQVFTGGQRICSAHPMMAISKKDTDLTQGVFTLEGEPQAVDEVGKILKKCGNQVEVISKESKTKYHCAASIASNLMIALSQMSIRSMEECGFSQETSIKMLGPLMKANMDNLINLGPAKALTGPVERSDIQTVQKHLDVLSEGDREIYRLLSIKLVDVAKEKNIDRDYSLLKNILEEERK